MARPSRRSDVPRHNSYQRYKPYLREDFTYACAYCGVHENEGGGPRFFTVEHYRPKSRFPKLRNEYRNLLYACAVCNGYKGDDWPSDDPVADGRGYLDPCDHDLGEHIGPAGEDELAGLTPVGRYMVERLRLNRGLLRKLRRLRREEERLHQQFVALVERSLALLEVELQRANLRKRQRKEIERELAALRHQQSERIAAWERRWEPLFTLEDYR
jgi:hypothetical protein